jgi:hypothetical protein
MSKSSWNGEIRTEDGKPVTSYDSVAFGGPVEISFNDSEISDGLKAYVRFVVEQEAVWFAKAMQVIVDVYVENYQSLYEGNDMGLSEAQLDEMRPKEPSVASMKKHVSAGTLTIAPETDLAGLGFYMVFDVTWDVEQGAPIDFYEWVPGKPAGTAAYGL